MFTCMSRVRALDAPVLGSLEAARALAPIVAFRARSRGVDLGRRAHGAFLGDALDLRAGRLTRISSLPPVQSLYTLEFSGKIRPAWKNFWACIDSEVGYV